MTHVSKIFEFGSFIRFVVELSVIQLLAAESSYLMEIFTRTKAYMMTTVTLSGVENFNMRIHTKDWACPGPASDENVRQLKIA